MEGFLFLQHFFIQKYVFAATRDTCQTCQTHPRALLIRGRLETIWTILRKFGYNDKLDLDEAFVCPECVLLLIAAPYIAVLTLPSLCRIEVRESEGERAEISSQGYGFLTDLFRRHDLDQDGVLNASELNELFAVCPEHTHPWEQFHFPHCTATDKHGNLTLQGFLGMWR